MFLALPSLESSALWDPCRRSALPILRQNEHGVAPGNENVGLYSVTFLRLFDRASAVTRENL